MEGQKKKSRESNQIKSNRIQCLCAERISVPRQSHEKSALLQRSTYIGVNLQHASVIQSCELSLVLHRH